jgi:hypothetical protein
MFSRKSSDEFPQIFSSILDHTASNLLSHHSSKARQRIFLPTGSRNINKFLLSTGDLFAPSLSDQHPLIFLSQAFIFLPDDGENRSLFPFLIDFQWLLMMN